MLQADFATDVVHTQDNVCHASSNQVKQLQVACSVGTVTFVHDT